MSQAFVILWTVAHQASLSMGFDRQEYWRGLPFPSPGNLHDPGIILFGLYINQNIITISHETCIEFAYLYH